MQSSKFKIQKFKTPINPNNKKEKRKTERKKEKRKSVYPCTSRVNTRQFVSPKRKKKNQKTKKKQE